VELPHFTAARKWQKTGLSKKAVFFLDIFYDNVIKHTFYYPYISNQILSIQTANHYILNNHMSIFPCFCGKHWDTRV